MSVKVSIQSVEELKSEVSLLINEAMREEREANSYLARTKAAAKVNGLMSALPYIEELVMAEEGKRLARITEPILAPRIIRQQPQTWGEVSSFVKEFKLDQGEHFTFTSGLDLRDAIWSPSVRAITVFAMPGSNEGYIVLINAYLANIERRGEIITPVVHQATGKYWSEDSALRAAELLTRYIFGWPFSPEMAPKVEEAWLREWKGG